MAPADGSHPAVATAIGTGSASQRAAAERFGIWNSRASGNEAAKLTEAGLPPPPASESSLDAIGSALWKLGKRSGSRALQFPRSVENHPKSVENQPKSVENQPKSVEDHPKSAEGHLESAEDHPRSAEDTEESAEDRRKIRRRPPKSAEGRRESPFHAYPRSTVVFRSQASFYCCSLTLPCLV